MDARGHKACLSRTGTQFALRVGTLVFFLSFIYLFYSCAPRRRPPLEEKRPTRKRPPTNFLPPLPVPSHPRSLSRRETKKERGPPTNSQPPPSHTGPLTEPPHLRQNPPRERPHRQHAQTGPPLPREDNNQNPLYRTPPSYRPCGK